MLVPSIFGENLFDDWMNEAFNDSFFTRRNPLYGKNSKNLMKTDVRETENSYELDIDLPGFKKDQISAELKDGLPDSIRYEGSGQGREGQGRKIHPQGSVILEPMTRSFYVGENITQG